jgi:hypothetical protein
VDSIAAVDPDSAAALVAADSVQRAARAAAAAEAPDPLAADSLPTPTRELILRVQPPLEAGDTLVVRVSGVRNLTGVPDGGGQVILRVPEPPPPDTAAIPPDAAPIRPDAAGIPPDTAAIAPDRSDTATSAAVMPSGISAISPGSSTLPPHSADLRPPQPARGRPHR